jgi:hypothetical protein
MGTLLVSDVISRAQDVLLDTSAVRWTSAELIRWVNDAQREIATINPASAAKIANVTLVAGTKQALPAGAIALIDVIRNMGVGGATPAEAPRRVAMEVMDLHKPSWHADTSTLVVKNWMHDPTTPRTFYVWPPMTSATALECKYSAIPVAVANTGDAITLDDFYLNAIVDYVLYRAFAKDLEVPGNAGKSAKHKAAFDAVMTEADATEKAQ